MRVALNIEPDCAAVTQPKTRVTVDSHKYVKPKSRVVAGIELINPCREAKILHRDFRWRTSVNSESENFESRYFLAEKKPNHQLSRALVRELQTITVDPRCKLPRESGHIEQLPEGSEALMFSLAGG